MPRSQFRTNQRLWAISSAIAFVALGFIDPVGGAAKGENSWWSKVFLLPSLNRHQLDEIVMPVLVYGVVLGLTAVVLGWVVQAPLVMCIGRSVQSAGIRNREPASG
ncbi:MAG: hypothetical protein U0791_00320 [Gemmataceae bacterium]